MKRSEVPTTPTAELVAEYNRITGKSIKKFASRAKAEEQTIAVLPPEKDAPSGRGRPMVDQLIRAVDGGTSAVREGSKRGQVLAAIRAHKQIYRSQLTDEVGFEVAGFVQKLAEVGHVEVVA